MNNQDTNRQVGEGSALLSTEDDCGRSAFRTRKEPGVTWRKILVFVLQLAPCIVAGWILLVHAPFEDDFSNLLNLPEGNHVRNVLLFAEIAVVMAAYEAKLCYIERQFRIWEIFFVIPFFSVLVAYVAIVARRNDRAVGIVDVLAGALVLSGTFLNTWPEIVRARWKALPENKGRLYTEGYFAKVRNPNYLGDLIWAIGWALASDWRMVAWFPVMTLCVLVFEYIPEKESYLSQRYADEWPAYEGRTYKLIPFVY